jgi:DNA primase
MPAPDFKAVIETIRDHNEITEVIGSYVQLKRAGSSFKACCPFHKEKTPSFHVNPTRQSFHCFGCGAGGDVFNFIMKYENLEFVPAAKFLADRAHLNVELEMDRGSGGPAVSTTVKDDLYRLHTLLRDWYQRCLMESSQAEVARAYLQERELNGTAAETFGIGYAPARDVDWPAWAAKRKCSMDLLLSAGIVLRNDGGGWYDRFANRLMFPIQDESGRVIGFSGRVLPGDPRDAKYVNSPETPLFTKSKIIYALHHAKKEILEKREAIICEGQIDVIRCHLAGVKHAVAAQGTAITEEHARILKRFTDSIRLVLDSDNAGKKAAMRSADVLLAAGLNVRIASLPPGDDPDSLIRRAGGPAFLTAVEAAVPELDFIIDTLMDAEPVQDDGAIRRVARAVIETVANVPSDLQRDQMLQRASRRLGMRPDVLAAEMRQVERRRNRTSNRTEEPEPETTEASAPITHPREELELIRLLIHYPLSSEYLTNYIDAAHLQSTTCRTLFTLLTAHAADEQIDIMAELPMEDTEARRVVAMLSAEDRFAGEELVLEKVAVEMIVVIRKKNFEAERRRIETRRRKASGDEANMLDMEMAEITLNLHTLRSGWAKAKPMLDLHRSMQ